MSKDVADFSLKLMFARNHHVNPTLDSCLYLPAELRVSLPPKNPLEILGGIFLRSERESQPVR
jgi:hypothetical protein